MSVIRDPVHGRLHFNVPYNITMNCQDSVKQSSPETLLDSPVPAMTSGPVFPLLVHKEQDLVKHHLELTRIFKLCQPSSARQQIPDGKVPVLVESGPGCLHSVNGLLIGNLGLSLHMVL